MLIKFYYFSAVRSTDTADTATATHYVPILHWLQPRQFSSNNAQLLWLVQFYCGVAGTGAGPGPVPGSYLWSFVTTWHLFGSQQSRARPGPTALAPCHGRQSDSHQIFLRAQNICEKPGRKCRHHRVSGLGCGQETRLSVTKHWTTAVPRAPMSPCHVANDLWLFKISNIELSILHVFMTWWLESKVKSV